MSKDDLELARLVRDEREACGRAERLDSNLSTMRDEGVRAMARRICEDAKNALRRFLFNQSKR
jgi:hypothetical protein